VQEGWHVIWVRGSLSESWTRLASGQIDLLPGVASTPERLGSYDFSNESALAVWSQVYARPGSGISTILDLDGKQVASVTGALSGIGFQDYARKFDVNVTLVEKDTPAEVFSMTAAGEADALVVYNTAGQEDAVTYGLVATPVMFNPSQFGFAVPKGKNHDLLDAIDRYLAKEKGDPSSTYSGAMQKWFGVKTGTTIPSWLFFGLAAVAVIALLFVAMSFVLRREVRKKTAELSQQNTELQDEIASRKRVENELVKKNEELQAAYAQLAATEEELRENLQEQKKNEQELMQARRKLNLLNTLTIQDVQSRVFSLAAYFQLATAAGCSGKAEDFLVRGAGILRTIEQSLSYAKKYQELGIGKPRWQNVNHTLITAISHLDFSRIQRTVELADLEIYADPLLEDVFVTLMENIVAHGTGATEVNVRYQENPDRNLAILVSDNGPGIPEENKENIFTWEYHGGEGSGLFLAREILSITGITIAESGGPGAGARFVITVPEGRYRFGAPKE
jgi:signal transduction histidine kinase